MTTILLAIATIAFLLPLVSAFTVPLQYSVAKSRSPLVKPILASQAAPKESDPQTGHDEDDWHPEDPASTTPQFLGALWQMIARGSNMVKGVSKDI